MRQNREEDEWSDLSRLQEAAPEGVVVAPGTMTGMSPEWRRVLAAEEMRR